MLLLYLCCRGGKVDPCARGTHGRLILFPGVRYTRVRVCCRIYTHTYVLEYLQDVCTTGGHVAVDIDSSNMQACVRR